MKSPTSSSATVDPVPAWMHTLTPHLICADGFKAIEFYQSAFDAKLLMALPMPDGTLMHAMMQIGDSHIMLGQENPKWGSVGPNTLKGSPVTLHLQVADVDQAFARAQQAGATVKMPLADTFWGDRYGVVVDPFGHNWSLASTIKNLSPEELQKAAEEAMAKMADGNCG